MKPLINKSLIPTFLWYIPLGVLVFSINNKEILYKILLKSSYFISAIVFIVFIQIFVGNSEEIKNYNMFFSYTLLLPTLIHITEFVRTKKKYLLFLSLFEILEILIYGARGPLLWIIIFSFFVIFINKNKIKKTFLVAITVFAIFIFINTDSFLLYLTKQLDYYDINSRTITLLTSNDITLLSSRDLIWNSSISLILEKPILGYGLGNEFYAISNDMNMGRDEIVSPHNGILQLALNFGILSGVILSVLIIISFFIIRKINNVFHRNLLLIFFFAFILPSITVGDGLLTKPGAAVYFYLFLNYIFQKNKYQNEIKLQKKIIHN
ncbi:MAG: O-antigen ligase family protein [Fermentimonas sp.]|nr:O-antigen ligase family protein [Fermentimonas sp.]